MLCYLDIPAGSHRITFLPLGSTAEIGKKAKFKKFFNIVYFSNRYVCMHAQLTCYATSKIAVCTLHKQVGDFNNRVVTLVVDKLERQWLRNVCFGSSYNQNTLTTLRNNQLVFAV